MGERTSELNRDVNHEVKGAGDQKSSDEIRNEIRQTQRDIGETVDSIHDRLSPTHMMDEAKETLRNAPRRAGEELMSRIKDNPIPAAIAGLGLWMLFRNDKNSNRYATSYDYRYPRGYVPLREPFYGTGRSDFPAWGYERGYDDGRGRMAHVADDVRDKAASVRNRASEFADDLGDKAHELTDRAQEFGDRAGEMSEEAVRRAEEYGRRMAFQARTSGQELWDTLQDNPVILGAAGVVVGALLGASIPETAPENRLMGGASDSVKESARSYAQEGVEKAKNVATAATEAATSTASKQIDRELDDVQQRNAGASASPSTRSGSTASMTRTTGKPAARTDVQMDPSGSRTNDRNPR